VKQSTQLDTKDTDKHPTTEIICWMLAHECLFLKTCVDIT